jgi:predicted porin
MYSQGTAEQHGDLAGANVVVARGLFAATLSAQRVKFGDGFSDPTRETAWQIGATYKLDFAQVFGLYTRTQDQGLDVRSNITSGGVAVPLGPGTVQAQVGFTTAVGPAVDRKHTSTSLAYVYPINSVTDLYVIGMDDRIRGQTNGLSAATGVRFKF